MMHSINGIYAPATRVIQPLSGGGKYTEYLPYGFGNIAYRPYVVALKTNSKTDRFDISSNPIEAYLTLPKVTMAMGIGAFLSKLKQGFEMYYKAVMLNPYYHAHFEEYFSDIESIQQSLEQRHHKIRHPYYFKPPSGDKTGFRSLRTADREAIQDYVRRYHFSQRKDAYSRAYWP